MLNNEIIKKKGKKNNRREEKTTTPSKTKFRSEACPRNLCKNEANNQGNWFTYKFLIIPSVITLNISEDRRQR